MKFPDSTMFAGVNAPCRVAVIRQFHGGNGPVADFGRHGSWRDARLVQPSELV